MFKDKVFGNLKKNLSCYSILEAYTIICAYFAFLKELNSLIFICKITTKFGNYACKLQYSDEKSTVIQ